MLKAAIRCALRFTIILPSVVFGQDSVTKPPLGVDDTLCIFNGRAFAKSAPLDPSLKETTCGDKFNFKIISEGYTAATSIDLNLVSVTKEELIVSDRPIFLLAGEDVFLLRSTSGKEFILAKSARMLLANPDPTAISPTIIAGKLIEKGHHKLALWTSDIYDTQMKAVKPSRDYTISQYAVLKTTGSPSRDKRSENGHISLIETTCTDLNGRCVVKVKNKNGAVLMNESFLRDFRSEPWDGAHVYGLIGAFKSLTHKRCGIQVTEEFEESFTAEISKFITLGASAKQTIAQILSSNLELSGIEFTDTPDFLASGSLPAASFYAKPVERPAILIQRSCEPTGKIDLSVSFVQGDKLVPIRIRVSEEGYFNDVDRNTTLINGLGQLINERERRSLLAYMSMDNGTVLADF